MPLQQATFCRAKGGLLVCKRLPFALQKTACGGVHQQTCWMVQSCSTDSLNLKYLSSSVVRVDDKSLFYSIRFEFGFHDILTATAANILFQVRLSVTVIPNLIWDPAVGRNVGD